MKEISLDERKKIMIDMLYEVDLFCKKNNINYFLIGGSLLGAIRHDGFIPWDDDIDIGLFREDYIKFVNEFITEKGYIKVLDYKNKKNYIWPSAKVIDDRTILIENGRNKNSIGIFIDVFPVDVIGGNINDAKIKVRKVQIWKNILTLKYLKIEHDRSIVKNFMILIGKILYLFPDNLIIKRINYLAQKDNKCKDYIYLCNYLGAWKEKEIVNKACFNSFQKHKFESIYVTIPSGYVEYLQTIYGNFMELPPVEKRISHHGNIAYWKNTF